MKFIADKTVAIRFRA